MLALRVTHTRYVPLTHCNCNLDLLYLFRLWLSFVFIQKRFENFNFVVSSICVVLPNSPWRTNTIYARDKRQPFCIRSIHSDGWASTKATTDNSRFVKHRSDQTRSVRCVRSQRQDERTTAHDSIKQAQQHEVQTRALRLLNTRQSEATTARETLTVISQTNVTIGRCWVC